MTPRQRDALEFIARYQDQERGVTPSYDEIKDALGLSAKSGVARLIDELEAQGRISRRWRHCRGITITGALSHVSDPELEAEIARRAEMRRHAV